MMKNNKKITPEEKLDFIYNYLKREDNIKKYRLFLNIFFRLAIVLSIIFSYFYAINTIKDSYKEVIDVVKLPSIKKIKDKMKLPSKEKVKSILNIK